MSDQDPKEKGAGPIYSAAYDSIRKGAPGLSDATCEVIARAINLKLAGTRPSQAQPPAREDAQPVACRFCDGAGWENDQNWEPRYADLPQEREKGDGLIRCGHCLGDGIDPSPDNHPAPDALRGAVEAIRAEINAPLSGPTHGAWDRGRIAGLKEALTALQAEGGA